MDVHPQENYYPTNISDLFPSAEFPLYSTTAYKGLLLSGLPDIIPIPLASIIFGLL
jgi:hypothetical protein